MSLIKPATSIQELENQIEYFIPHYGVLQGSKKLRVVFNATACCSNKTSLNDCSLTGASLHII